MSLSSKCCCLSLRGGVLAANAIIMSVGLCNAVFVLVIANDTMIQWLPWLRNEILYWGAFLAWASTIVTFSVGWICMNLGKGASKAIAIRRWTALLVFNVLCWVIYGLHFSIKLRSVYVKLLPGEHLTKFAMTRAKTGLIRNVAFVGSVASSFVLNPIAMQVAYRILPYPLDILYWLGVNIITVIIPFVGFPLISTVASLPCILSYANVLEQGGDGTEGLPPEDIKWYLSLPPDKQQRLRKGRSLSSSPSSSSSSSSSSVTSLSSYATTRRNRGNRSARRNKREDSASSCESNVSDNVSKGFLR